MKEISEKESNAIAHIGTKVASQETSVLEEKRSLQIKHEKICAENKAIKNENNTLSKDINSKNIALKSAQKELKDSAYKSTKKTKRLQRKKNLNLNLAKLTRN